MNTPAKCKVGETLLYLLTGKRYVIEEVRKELQWYYLLKDSQGGITEDRIVFSREGAKNTDLLLLRRAEVCTPTGHPIYTDLTEYSQDGVLGFFKHFCLHYRYGHFLMEKMKMVAHSDHTYSMSYMADYIIRIKNGV